MFTIETSEDAMGQRQHKTFRAACAAVAAVILDHGVHSFDTFLAPVFVRRFGRPWTPDEREAALGLIVSAIEHRRMAGVFDPAAMATADVPFIAQIAAQLFGSPSATASERTLRPALTLAEAGIVHPVIAAHERRRIAQARKARVAPPAPLPARPIVVPLPVVDAFADMARVGDLEQRLRGSGAEIAAVNGRRVAILGVDADPGVRARLLEVIEQFDKDRLAGVPMATGGE